MAIDEAAFNRRARLDAAKEARAARTVAAPVAAPTQLSSPTVTRVARQLVDPFSGQMTLGEMNGPGGQRALQRLAQQGVAPQGVITPQELFMQTPAGQARTLGRLGVPADLSPPLPGRTGYTSGVSPLATMTAEDLAGLPESARANAYQRLATAAAPGPAAGVSAAPAAAMAPAPYAVGAPAASGALTATDDLLGLNAARNAPAAARLGASAAAPAATAAKEVAKQGMMSGLMGRAPLAGLASQLGMGSAAAPGSRLAAIGTGTLGRALPWVAAGQIGGEIAGRVWNDPNSSSDNAFKNALQLGGAGAAIGSMIAPGVGTAVGGGLGLGVGWLAGKYGPKSTGDVAVAKELDKQGDQLLGLMNQLGLQDPNARMEILGQLQAGAMGVNSQADVKMMAAQLAQQIPALASQLNQERAATEGQQARMLAVQQLFAPMIQDSLYGVRQRGAETRSAFDQVAAQFDQTDPQMAALYRARGALMEQQAGTTAAAYATQASLAQDRSYEQDLQRLQQRVQNSQLQQLSRQLLTGVAQESAGMPGA